ncbi:hypothetical protein KDJ21_007615 [Metabacillus litoralis]|uniref:hypothetical protein n=1 Tax=Metabacillus litoralis TaxID=152268 RepID=UPI001E321B8B|nr:hypothetical protein [Metabacillus litoralis]UHA61513.1 hypothetical protein KDJ21_007615 [Metabacillus litoralis]
MRLDKKHVTKVVAPSVLATAVMVAVAPGQVDAASSISNLVKQAQLSSNQLVSFYEIKNQENLVISNDFLEKYQKATSDILKAEKALKDLKMIRILTGIKLS